MMNDMMSGMMGGMGLVAALILIVLVLGAGALIKHLFFKQGRLMMHRVLFAGFAVVLVSSPLPAQENNVARGQRDFRVCAPCHSLEPDRNMTGPSLANLWRRKAGSLPSSTATSGR
jgi:hypothetical protein